MNDYMTELTDRHDGTATMLAKLREHQPCRLAPWECLLCESEAFLSTRMVVNRELLEEITAGYVEAEADRDEANDRLYELEFEQGTKVSEAVAFASSIETDDVEVDKLLTSLVAMLEEI